MIRGHHILKVLIYTPIDIIVYILRHLFKYNPKSFRTKLNMYLNLHFERKLLLLLHKQSTKTESYIISLTVLVTSINKRKVVLPSWGATKYKVQNTNLPFSRSECVSNNKLELS